MRPIAGSFGVYAETYLNEWSGFAMRATYTIDQNIAIVAFILLRLSLITSVQIGRGWFSGISSVRCIRTRTATIAAANPDAAPTPSAQRGPK